MKLSVFFGSKLFYLILSGVAAASIVVTVVTVSVLIETPEDTSVAPTDITPTEDDGSGSGSEGSGDAERIDEQEKISQIIQSLSLKPIVYDEENEEDLISEGFIRLNHV